MASYYVIKINNKEYFNIELFQSVQGLNDRTVHDFIHKNGIKTEYILGNLLFPVSKEAVKEVTDKYYNIQYQNLDSRFEEFELSDETKDTVIYTDAFVYDATQERMAVRLTELNISDKYNLVKKMASFKCCSNVMVLIGYCLKGESKRIILKRK